MKHTALALAMGILMCRPCLGQGAIDLNGTTGLGRVPDHPSLHLSGDFTLEAIVVFDSLAQSRQSTILSKLSTWNAEYVALEYTWPESQRFYFGGRGGGVEWRAGIDGFVPELGRCYHVAGVRQGDTFTFYLDGAPRDTSVIPGVGDPSNPGDLLIGQVMNSIRWFPGKIDEVRVWSRARSAAEIAAWSGRSPDGSESGLVGLWRFDDGPGATFADASPSHNDGTLSGGYTWTSDACVAPNLDLAVRLDGRTGYGTVPDNPAYHLPGNFTIEAEVVFDSLALSRQSTILSKMAAWNVENVVLEYSYPESQHLHFGGRGGGVEWNVHADFLPELGRCYHLAGVRQGDGFSLYLDGVRVASQVLPGVGDPSNTGEWQIGQVMNSIRWFPGRIDEVRVWNLARSQAQIVAGMFVRVPGDEPGLVACWRFDDGAGGAFCDVSPTANPGQLHGNWSWVEDACAPAAPDLDARMWLQTRGPGWNEAEIGFSQGPYAQVNRGLHARLRRTGPGDGAELALFDATGAPTGSVATTWEDGRWIPLRFRRYPHDLWTVTWDEAGPHAAATAAGGAFSSFTDPHLWLSPQGPTAAASGFLLDDVEATFQQGEQTFTLQDGWEDGVWRSCPAWQPYADADIAFDASHGSGHVASPCLAGWRPADSDGLAALFTSLIAREEPLAPVDSLDIAMSPDGSAHLGWNAVTQDLCGEPAHPEGYVVTYSERGPYDQDFYYLTFTSSPGFTHERVGAFRNVMYYRVYAWSGPALDWARIPERTPLSVIHKLAAERSR